MRSLGNSAMRIHTRIRLANGQLNESSDHLISSNFVDVHEGQMAQRFIGSTLFIVLLILAKSVKDGSSHNRRQRGNCAYLITSTAR